MSKQATAASATANATDADDDDEGKKGPKGNYIMFKAEGDLYQTRGLWQKAIDSYTRVSHYTPKCHP